MLLAPIDSWARHLTLGFIFAFLLLRTHVSPRNTLGEAGVYSDVSLDGKKQRARCLSLAELLNNRADGVISKKGPFVRLDERYFSSLFIPSFLFVSHRFLSVGSRLLRVCVHWNKRTGRCTGDVKPLGRRTKLTI